MLKRSPLPQIRPLNLMCYCGIILYLPLSSTTTDVTHNPIKQKDGTGNTVPAVEPDSSFEYNGDSTTNKNKVFPQIYNTPTDDGYLTPTLNNSAKENFNNDTKGIVKHEENKRGEEPHETFLIKIIDGNNDDPIIYEGKSPAGITTRTTTRKSNSPEDDKTNIESASDDDNDETTAKTIPAAVGLSHDIKNMNIKYKRNDLKRLDLDYPQAYDINQLLYSDQPNDVKISIDSHEL